MYQKRARARDSKIATTVAVIAYIVSSHAAIFLQFFKVQSAPASAIAALENVFTLAGE